MNENILIKESCGRLRERGRLSLSGLWKKTFCIILLCCVMIAVPALIINYIGGYPKEICLFSNIYVEINESPYTIFYWYLINGRLAVIVASIFLGIVRYNKVDYSELFNKVNSPAKSVLLFIVVNIFIFLWSLLLIVPGIIAGIRYSQAFYILAEDSSKSIMQCISESKAMMKGNKKKFFLMELSFAGWMLLSIAPAAIIAAIMEVYISEFWCNILFTILLFPVIWVIVYLKSTEANFYELLVGCDKINDNPDKTEY